MAKLDYMGINWPGYLKTKFQTVFGVYSLILATFLFESDLNLNSFILVQGLFVVNRISTGL